MGFKRLKCPVCGQKVSFLWNYFSFPPITYTCSNCKTKIKWHPIMRLYNFILAIIMFSIFLILRNYIRSEYALLIALILINIIYLLISKKVKIIDKDEEKKM